jgi:DNA-directed RNA polymerase specialized sigma24 family protein
MHETPAITETDPRLTAPAEATTYGPGERGPFSAECWASGLRRIERLVRHAPVDQRALRVRLRPRGSHHEARVVLVLPADTLVGLGEGATADLAFSGAIGWLAGELRRRAETARAEALESRRRLRRRDIAGATGFLVLDHARGDDASFIDVFRPLMRHARDHAYRELAAAECVGAPDVSAVTMSDVFDQTLVRAWDRFGDRPRDRGIDEWLITLLEEVIDEYVGDAVAPSASRGDEAQRIARLAARHERLADREPHWGARALLSLEAVLPDVEPSDLLAGLGPDAEDRMLTNLLADVPTAQRRAFTLATLEGYGADEIGRIQSRSPDAVRTDIGRVRDRLFSRVTDSD